MKHSILIMDDEYGIREFLFELFKNDFKVFLAESGQQGLELLQEHKPDIALIDMRMPVLTGLQVLARISDMNVGTISIMITADRDVKDVVEAMRLGAYDYLTKPVDFRKLQVTVKNALEKKKLTEKVVYLEKEMNHRLIFPNFIGESEVVESVLSIMENVLDNDATVLITGESGTGKEVVAKSIHYEGNRKNRHFVAVDCASIPASLIETELFGYEKGAFTGASKMTPGKFELADGGTLFLDEIPNISLEAQSKLLRVIQEREFTRVGGNRKIKVDVRIISASNRDLKEMIREGSFREDLYYRLNVIPLHLPALRERVEDIPILVRYFLDKMNEEYGRSVQFTSRVVRRFVTYNWPGNVRELENLIKRLVLMVEGNEVDLKDLPSEFRENTPVAQRTSYFLNVEHPLAEVEKVYIENILDKKDFNVSQTAKILGISRKSLYERMRKFGIHRH